MILVSAATLLLTAWLGVEAAAWLVLLDRRRPGWGAKRDAYSVVEGSYPPAMAVRTLAGSLVPVGVVRPRPTLLVFFSPTCPSCEELAPALRAFHRYWHEDVQILIVGRGDQGALQSQLQRLRLDHVEATASGILWEAFRVRLSPFAVLLNRDGMIDAQGIVNDLEQLEYLVDPDPPRVTVDLSPGGDETHPASEGARSPAASASPDATQRLPGTAGGNGRLLPRPPQG